MDSGLDVAFAETQKPFTEMGSMKAKRLGVAAEIKMCSYCHGNRIVFYVSENMGPRSWCIAKWGLAVLLPP